MISEARKKYGFKLYHASSLQIKGVDSLPVSYLLTYTGTGAQNMDFIESHPTKGVCLDSGAYPAAKQNKDLDLGGYIKFVKEHQQNLDWFAQLDFIPRSFGDTTANLQKYAADETWERYKAMHEAPEGLDISKLAFVVHGQSDIEPNLVRALTWRSKKSGRGVEMIACGLSFPDPALRNRQLKILDRVFKEFNFTGKFHALGLQDRDLFVQYPFITSADSSSSIRAAISGMVRIGSEDYKVLDDEKLSHKSKISPKMRELQKQFLQERCTRMGRDWNKAGKQEGYVERWIWNCLERDRFLIPKEFQDGQ